MRGRASERRFRDKNRPPQDQPWIWLTREMLESEAWAAMPLAARKIVERVAIEHMGHGGSMNGELVVTYDDFENYGIRRRSIAQAIRIAIALGFLDLTERGRRSYGTSRRPSRYGLTWLPRSDWTPASNRWKQFTTPDEAKAALERVRPTTHSHHVGPWHADIESRGGVAPRAETPNSGETASGPDGDCAPDTMADAPPQTVNKRHRGNSSRSATNA